MFSGKFKGLLSCFKFLKTGQRIQGLKKAESFLMWSALPKTQRRVLNATISHYRHRSSNDRWSIATNLQKYRRTPSVSQDRRHLFVTPCIRGSKFQREGIRHEVLRQQEHTCNCIVHCALYNFLVKFEYNAAKLIIQSILSIFLLFAVSIDNNIVKRIQIREQTLLLRQRFNL